MLFTCLGLDGHISFEKKSFIPRTVHLLRIPLFGSILYYRFIFKQSKFLSITPWFLNNGRYKIKHYHLTKNLQKIYHTILYWMSQFEEQIFNWLWMIYITYEYKSIIYESILLDNVYYTLITQELITTQYPNNLNRLFAPVVYCWFRNMIILGHPVFWAGWSFHIHVSWLW